MMDQVRRSDEPRVILQRPITPSSSYIFFCFRRPPSLAASLAYASSTHSRRRNVVRGEILKSLCDA